MLGSGRRSAVYRVSVYNTPHAERVRKLNAEIRFVIQQARIEKRYAYGWGFVAGIVATLALDMILSL